MKKTPEHLTIFTSPADVTKAFLAALEARDIEAMMALWADDEEITCTHPGGPRLTGYRAVRDAWEQVFMNTASYTFHHGDVIAVETIGLASQSAYLRVYTQDGKLRGTIAVTTVFLRTPVGWRLVCYHASPVPPENISSPTSIIH